MKQKQIAGSLVAGSVAGFFAERGRSWWIVVMVRDASRRRARARARLAWDRLAWERGRRATAGRREIEDEVTMPLQTISQIKPGSKSRLTSESQRKFEFHEARPPPAKPTPILALEFDLSHEINHYKLCFDFSRKHGNKISMSTRLFNPSGISSLVFVRYRFNAASRAYLKFSDFSKAKSSNLPTYSLIHHTHSTSQAVSSLRPQLPFDPILSVVPEGNSHTNSSLSHPRTESIFRLKIQVIGQRQQESQLRMVAALTPRSTTLETPNQF
ncbi:hypothetical protein Drorol1_Dr00012645 [Drosera rotundifolia]